MEIPIQITFHGIGQSSAISDYVRQRAAKLGTFFDRIIGCHVTLEVPHRHHRHGAQYRVRIDVTVPGAKLVVGRTPDEDSAHRDIYAAIDDAFDGLGRVLQDYVRKRTARDRTLRHDQTRSLRHETAIHGECVPGDE
jgi:ribosomal subunit interface protein